MVKKSDIVKLAKKFNMSHHYKRGNAEIAPHHHREQMTCVAAKAKAEMVAHRNSRKKAK